MVTRDEDEWFSGNSNCCNFNPGVREHLMSLPAMKFHVWSSGNVQISLTFELQKHPDRSSRNFGLDEGRKLGERFLPAEIAHLQRDDLGQPFLHYVQLGSTRYLFQSYGRPHFSGQVRIVEVIRVANFSNGTSSRYSPPNE